MALRKRQPSLRIRKATERYEAMKRIDEQQSKVINYGGEQNLLTSGDMIAKIRECENLTSEYNGLLELADEKAKQILEAEEELGNYFTRVLAGAKSIYGVDSDEVELLGGTKKSARKKSERTVKQITQNISTA